MVRLTERPDMTLAAYLGRNNNTTTTKIFKVVLEKRIAVFSRVLQ